MPLLSVNHPEYPSAHAFWTSAVTEIVARYFGTRNVTWTLTTSKTAVPQLVQTERTYHNLMVMRSAAGNARVWAGLHGWHSLDDGDQIGIGVLSVFLKIHSTRTSPATGSMSEIA